jgi:hypothetical protein
MHKYVPNDLTHVVLQIMQSSTVPKFNNIFSMMEAILVVAATGMDTSTTLVDVDTILDAAESEYNKLLSTQEWTGITTPVKSSFTSGHNICCWNCGQEGGYGLQQCPQPKLPEQIEQHKKAFCDNKAKECSPQGKKGKKPKGGRGSSNGIPATDTGKFARPSHSDHGQHIIDGNLYKYSSKKKMWFNQGLQAAPMAQVAAAPTDGSVNTQTTLTSSLTAVTGSPPGMTSQPVANVANISLEMSRAQTLRAAATVRASGMASLLKTQLDEMNSLQH